MRCTWALERGSVIRNGSATSDTVKPSQFFSFLLPPSFFPEKPELPLSVAAYLSPLQEQQLFALRAPPPPPPPAAAAPTSVHVQPRAVHAWPDRRRRDSTGPRGHMMPCWSLGDRIRRFLRDYDSLQSLAVVLIYIQVSSSFLLNSLSRDSLCSRAQS